MQEVRGAGSAESLHDVDRVLSAAVPVIGCMVHCSFQGNKGKGRTKLLQAVSEAESSPLCNATCM